MVIFFLALPFVLIAIALVVAWLASRSARTRATAFDALADGLGVRRRKGETDVELRARLASLMCGAPRATTRSLEDDVRGMLWEHGYPRADVRAESAPGTGLIRVHVLSPKVPAAVLTTIEREMAERIPAHAVIQMVLP